MGAPGSARTASRYGPDMNLALGGWLKRNSCRVTKIEKSDSAYFGGGKDDKNQGLPWASIIGWTGGQVPTLFEVGDVMCFVPPLFGATNIYCVNLLFSCY